MANSDWNGDFVTPMRVAHTLTPEAESPTKKKQRTSATTASLSLRDGTRLTMIRKGTSPFMGHDVKFPKPQLPLVVVSYSQT